MGACCDSCAKTGGSCGGGKPCCAGCGAGGPCTCGSLLRGNGTPAACCAGCARGGSCDGDCSAKQVHLHQHLHEHAHVEIRVPEPVQAPAATAPSGAARPLTPLEMKLGRRDRSGSFSTKGPAATMQSQGAARGAVRASGAVATRVTDAERPLPDPQLPRTPPAPPSQAQFDALRMRAARAVGQPSGVPAMVRAAGSAESQGGSSMMQAKWLAPTVGVAALAAAAGVAYWMLRDKTPMPCKEAARTLGVPSGADAQEIRTAHRRAAFVNHPDRGGSAERMASINAARDVLLSGTCQRG